MHLFAALVTLLRLEAHGGDRAGVEPLEGDRFAGHFAVAVFAFVDAAQRRVDLGDQLALAVAGTQFQRPVGFLGSAVGDVGDVAGVFLKTFDGVAAVEQQFILPGQKFASEVFGLTLVHEGFVLGGTVVFWQKCFCFHCLLPNNAVPNQNFAARFVHGAPTGVLLPRLQGVVTTHFHKLRCTAARIARVCGTYYRSAETLPKRP